MNSDQYAPDERPIHPNAVMMALLLMGISTLFLGAAAAYIYSRVTHDAPAPLPPVVFYVNIPILLVATHFLRKVTRSELRVIQESTIRHLLVVLGLTGLFVILQVIGWRQFFEHGPSMQSSQPRSYLFVLSGLHLLHVIGGLPFLFVFIHKIHKHLKAAALVNRAKQLRYAKSLLWYWNFLDILWILLVALLLGSALLSS